jgi:uncharacterized protein YlxW (UPF0749 family)
VLDIGHTILVNSAYLSPPYQVKAIGQDRPARSDERVAGLARLHPDPAVARSGSDIAFAEPPRSDIPAFAGSLTLRASRIVPSPAPSAATP